MLATASFDAQARDLRWDVGISVPGPVYVQPAPIYTRPAPIYYRPAPVYMYPQPVVIYGPPQVQPRFRQGQWMHNGHWHGNQWHQDFRRKRCHHGDDDD
jgi:PXPV repeat (3 copies)